jgi:hypothetical protein
VPRIWRTLYRSGYTPDMPESKEAQSRGEIGDDRRRLVLRPKEFGRCARFVVIFEKVHELVLHNREIYGDWLRLSAAEIAALERDGVV